MAKKCPVCNAVVPLENAGICPQCGGKIGRTFWEMTEGEQALYVRRLALAMKEGVARRAAGPEAVIPEQVEKGEPGPTHPVHVRLQAEEDRPAVAGAELHLPGRSIPVEMGNPERSSESVPLVWKEPVTGMEFVRVEAGCYPMGAGDWDDRGYPNEKPVHEVCLDGFWIGRYPVTQGEWKQVMGSNPSQFRLGDSYPVECVSWQDTRLFLKRLMALNDDLHAFRLPTEAEWEYACRSGGRPERYAGGTRESDLEELGWHEGNSEGSPHDVGAKKPNALGLHDMSGNIWEWCEDIYCDTAYERHDRNNPAWRTGEPDRVIRGGSWYSRPEDARCCQKLGQKLQKLGSDQTN